MPRFGLSSKIFLGSAAIITALLVATLVVTSYSARTSAEQSIQRGLSETNARIAEQLDGRQTELVEKVRGFVDDRNRMQVIAADTEGNNALDQARGLAQDTKAEWVQITDAKGMRKAKSDDPGAEKADLTTSPLIPGALSGSPTRGFGVIGDSAIIEVVALPLLRDLSDSSSVVGVVMAAIRVSDTLAKAIGARTGSQIAFYALERNTNKPRIAGSTLPAAERFHLQDEIARRESAAGSSPSDSGAKAKHGGMMGPASERATIDVGGIKYVGQRTQLLNAAQVPVGGFLTMRSLDEQLSGFYALRRTLLVTGIAGLVLAFLLSGAITRQIVRPVKALVSATRRAADGDYNAEIPASSGDEIGTLAEAVRRLLSDLRDKQALVDFLGGENSSSSSATVITGGDATLLLPGATPRVDGNLAPGRTLNGRYEVKAVLGAGGMGMVYRALDRELQEVVAIKTLKPEMLSSDDTALERFKGEIRLARKISHRNVVRTHDIGESQGLYFITMEFVEGTSLKDLVKQRGRLPVQVLLPIAKQLCRALEVAHEAGVIHRDIKPQNMVVERDGTLKVMDFGIARLASRSPTAGLTQAGMVIGTPEYMAPEQLLGDDIDVRADLYSAGVVLYECLTGRLPFEAPTPIVLITRVLEESPPAPHTLFSDIPQSVSLLVMRAMSRDRDLRPASAESFHDALEQVG